MVNAPIEKILNIAFNKSVEEFYVTGFDYVKWSNSANRGKKWRKRLCHWCTISILTWEYHDSVTLVSIDILHRWRSLDHANSSYWGCYIGRCYRLLYSRIGFDKILSTWVRFYSKFPRYEKVKFTSDNVHGVRFEIVRLEIPAHLKIKDIDRHIKFRVACYPRPPFPSVSGEDRLKIPSFHGTNLHTVELFQSELE